LVVVGLWLTAVGIGSADGPDVMIAARLARAALFVFGTSFTMLDAIGGIGLGRTIVVVQDMAAGGTFDARQMAGIELLLNTLWSDPVIGGVGSFVSETASWAALAPRAKRTSRQGCLSGCGLAREGPPFVEEIP
jgi:hypothetical protein